MDYNNNQNQTGGGNSGSVQQNWTQQNVPQRAVVINELQHKKDGMAVCSLVLGILGLVFFWLVGVSVVICLIGLILGIVSVARTKQQRGVAAAGIITSALGLALSVIITLVYILLV